MLIKVGGGKSFLGNRKSTLTDKNVDVVGFIKKNSCIFDLPLTCPPATFNSMSLVFAGKHLPFPFSTNTRS